MVYIIPIILILHFGGNSWKSDQKYQSYECMKNWIKMWVKTCFHEFYGGQLKQLYTTNFLHGF